MKSEKIVNEAGEQLKTKDGLDLVDYTFEVGDTFIPQHNSIIVSQKGEAKFPKYLLLCKVKDKDGNVVKSEDGKDEIFVRLTESQNKSMQKKIDSAKADRENTSLQITQHVFVAYEYDSKDYGKAIGVGFQPNNLTPIDFE